MTFHTAMSTAFPQPAPGTAPSPGPMTVPADQLHRMLGLTDVTFVQRAHSLAIVDHNLGAPTTSAAISIDNFSFGMATLEVPVGTTVTWTNKDDVPHTVTSTTKVFKSGPLDTGESFAYTFRTVGTFEYFCSMHARMTGKIVVK
jgi:plastocyanin